MPASWRARTESGSLAIARNTAQLGEADERIAACEHPELRLLELLSVERQARNQERDRETDARHGSGTEDLGEA